MFDYPIHDERRSRFSNSRELKDILLHRYPLTKEFIDWVIEQGFEVICRSTWKAGTGSVWWTLKIINISLLGEVRLVKKVLVHELIHISVPGNHDYIWSFEEIIDEITEVYLSDPRFSEFMEYLKKKMPLQI